VERPIRSTGVMLGKSISFFFIKCTGKKWFCYGNKIRTTNKFSVTATKRFAAATKGFVIPTRSFVQIGIAKKCCYNNKMFSSINKTFGCCSEILGCSNKKCIFCL